MIVAGEHRLEHLDALRGFALLGILVMNVQSFSMPAAAYINPTAYGDLTGANLVVWWVSHLVFDRKFVTLFSLLFGAGIVLFAERAEAKVGRPAWLHYRRMLWLLPFGAAHAYLLWYGDILVSYGLCGMAVYPLRRKRIGLLLGLGFALIAVASGVALLHHFSLREWPLQDYTDILNAWAPHDGLIANELAAYRGGFAAQMQHRAPAAALMESQAFLNSALWRISGLMLVGMALFKLGIIQGQRDTRFYRRLALGCLLPGLAVVAYGAHAQFAHGWALEYSLFAGSQFNEWGSLLVAAGLLGLVMWVAHAGRLAGLRERLTAIGRTAFSNYILQSALGVLVFYGTGLGLFGRVSRVGQVAFVGVVWLVQLWLAPWWLRRFQFGPLEWAWRSLTYWRRAPWRRSTAA